MKNQKKMTAIKMSLIAICFINNLKKLQQQKTVKPYMSESEQNKNFIFIGTCSVLSSVQVDTKAFLETMETHI